MKAIALVQTTNKDVNQLQQNISQSVNPLIQNPITQGTLLKSQVLKVGTNVINHGLGYSLTGYLIVAANGAYGVHDNVIGNSDLTTSFNLISTTAVTVNIYCF